VIIGGAVQQGNTGQLKWEFFLDYWRTPVIQEMSSAGQIRVCFFLILTVGLITLVIDLISGVPVGMLMLLTNSLIKALGYTAGMIVAEILITYFSKRNHPNSGISVGKIWLVSFFGFVVGFALLEPYRQFMGHLEHHGSENRFLFFLKISPVWVLITYMFIQFHMNKSLQTEVSQLQQINTSLEERQTRMKSSEWVEESESVGSKFSTALFESPGTRNKQPFPSGQISYVNVIEHYCYIHHWVEGELQELELKLPLKEIIGRLPNDLFVQIHRSYLVNVGHIIQLKRDGRSFVLYLRGMDQPIPISRYRLSEVLPKLQPFLDKA